MSVLGHCLLDSNRLPVYAYSHMTPQFTPELGKAAYPTYLHLPLVANLLASFYSYH